MNLRHAITMSALVGLLSATQAATITFNDFFNGAALNTADWSASTPFSDSLVGVSGGNLILNNRGRVLTDAGFNQPIDMLMGFQITGSQFDSFKIFLRTDGVSTNGSAEFDNGIFASFRLKSDTGQTSGNVTLSHQNHPASLGPLATGTYAMSLNESLLIRLTDDGTNVKLYINDLNNPFLIAANTATFGNQIGFYNREGAGAGSYISAGSQVKVDFVSITSNVPDAGSSVLLVALGMLGLAGIHQRRRALFLE